MTHEVKLSGNMGKLIPINFLEVMPADKWKGCSEVNIKLAPLVAPMMHRCDVYVHHFYVPWRIVWDKFDDYLMGLDDTLTMPKIGISTVQNNSLADYFGIPSVQNASLQVSSLPFRAYQEIYNQYYRDQNLIDPIYVSHGNTDGTTAQIAALTTLRDRCWEKDYFTSCLPWAQKGTPVRIPGTGEPVRIDGSTDEDDPVIINSEGVAVASASREDVVTQSATIRDLRRAEALQSYLEKDGIAGTRKQEWYLAHYGVAPSDGRIDKPEYLCGGKLPIRVGEVVQTSSTDSTSPQGNRSGIAGSSGNTNRFSKTFTEFGCIISILSVMPKPCYQQGLSRFWMRDGKYDWPFPEFANIGEQAVYNYEIDAVHTSENNRNGVFGYQSRYAEMKFQPDRVCGDFRTSLNFWHMGRIFDNLPQLNESFVKCDPTTRVFAVTDTNVDHLWIDVLNKFSVVRALPKYDKTLL